MKILYALVLGFGIILYVVYVIHLVRIGHPQPLLLHALVAMALSAIIYVLRKRTPEHQ